MHMTGDSDVVTAPNATRTWGCTSPLRHVAHVEVSQTVPIHTLWADVSHVRALGMDAGLKKVPGACRDAYPRHDFLYSSKCPSNCALRKLRAGMIVCGQWPS